MSLQSSAASDPYEKTAAEIRASNRRDRMTRAYRRLGSVLGQSRFLKGVKPLRLCAPCAWLLGLARKCFRFHTSTNTPPSPLLCPTYSLNSSSSTTPHQIIRKLHHTTTATSIKTKSTNNPQQTLQTSLHYLNSSQWVCPFTPTLLPNPPLFLIPRGSL